MTLFIWNEAQNATTNYHHEGGIVVIAATLERARSLINEKAGVNCDAIKAEPDLIRDCEGEEYIAIHPNAGCC